MRFRIAVLIPLILFGVICSARAEQANLKPIWTAQFGNQEGHCETTAAAVAPDGALYAAGKQEDVTGKAVPWLWKINKIGKRVAESSFFVPESDDTKITALEIIGEAIVISAISSDKSYLLFYDTLLNLTSTVLIEEADANIHVSDIIPAEEGYYFLIGYLEISGGKTDSFLMKINAKGEMIWKRKYDNGEYDAFLTGTFSNNKLLLFGTEGSIALFSFVAGESRILVLDSEGEVLREKQIKGVSWGAYCNQDRFYILSVERHQPTGDASIRMTVFNANLELENDALLTRARLRSPRPWQIEAVGSAGLLVAGSTDRPWVGLLDFKGNLRKTFFHQLFEDALPSLSVSLFDRTYLFVSVLYDNPAGDFVSNVGILTLENIESTL